MSYEDLLLDPDRESIEQVGSEGGREGGREGERKALCLGARPTALAYITLRGEDAGYEGLAKA